MIRSSVERLLPAIRRRIPHWLLPVVLAVRFRLAWARESVRADARRQMNHLLGHARPDADLESAAKAYVWWITRRGELRWHPEIITRVRVEGIEHLRAARDQGRGAMLVYTHHGMFDGAMGAISRLGVVGHHTAFPTTTRDDAPPWLKQHVAMTLWGGGTAVSTAVGTQGMVELLQQGHVVSIACDVAGSTPVHVLGRDLLGSFGAARVPYLADSPVVLLTSERDEQGDLVRLHEPLDPRDFDGPEELLRVILARHEEALLAWPEAHDVPLSRWRDLSEASDA